jgi:hypothetical protein
MAYLWWFLVFVTIVVYPAILIRGAVKGRPWALETLKAMRYLNGETMVWRERSPEPPVRRQTTEPGDDVRELEGESEPGRLVA